MRGRALLLAGPALGTIAALMLLPMLIAAAYSVLTPGAYGGVAPPVSAESYLRFLFARDLDDSLVFDDTYLVIFARSVALAGAATELYLGLPPCQTDTANMKKVEELLEKQKPFVKVYNSDGTIDRISSGEVWIQQMWNGDAARARINNPDVRFVFPKEGVTGWMDSLAIPKGAKDPDNARKFMEFMLKPENSAISSNFTHYASALSAVPALYDDAMKASPELQVPADERIDFTPACSPEATRLVDRVWTRLKQ